MIINGEEIYLIDVENEDNIVILYAPLRRFIGTINQESKNKIIAKNSSAIEEMMCRLKKNPIISLHTLNDYGTKYPRYNINLTDNCQLRCLYCYDSACSAESDKDMSLNEVESVVDACIAYSRENFSSVRKIRFSLFGGAEPTYNKELFYHTIEYIKSKCKEENLEFELGMTTNGCYSPDVMDYIIDNFSGITFSIDGPKIIHDFQRPLANGHSSFDIVFKNAKKLYNSNVLNSFRVTVTSYTLNHWKELMDFFINNFPNSKVTLAPVLPLGRGRSQKELVPQKNEWENTLKIMYDYSKDKINLNLLTIVDPSVLRTSYCGVGKGTLWIISKNGDIVCCSHDRNDELFKIGKLDFERKKIRIDKNKVEILKKKFNVNEYPECHNCFCKYTCSGGCPSQRENGLMINCQLIKEFTAQLFYDTIKKKKKEE